MLSCALYRYTNSSGVYGIVCGALSASLLYALMGVNSVRRFAVVIASAAVLCLTAVSVLNVVSLLSIGVRLAGAQGIMFFALSLTLVVSVNFVVERWPGVRFLEAPVLLIVASNLSAAHRHGRIQRPFWLYDTFAEHGIPSSIVLEWLGFAVLLLVCIRLAFATRPLQGDNAALRSLPRAFCEVIAIWTLCIIVGHRIQPLGPNVSSPLTPPPAAQDGPPPPPTARNIALVKFENFYLPPARLAAYYFRTAPHDDRAPINPSGQLSAGGETITTVRMFTDGDKVPLLVSFDSLVERTSGPAPFALSFTLRSQPLGGINAKDVDLAYDLGNLGQQFTSPMWTEEVMASLLDYGHDQRLADLVRSILDPEGVEAKQTPEYVAVKTERWLAKQCTLSEKKGSQIQDGDLSSFLYGDHVGGTKQFAEAFVRLLRAAGVPARNSSGYVFRLPSGNAAGQNFKEAILLTDQHAEQWAEIYLDGTGWVPVPIDYENIIDKIDPPPQQDLEDVLASIASRPNAGNRVDTPTSQPSHSVTRILVALTLLGVLSIAIILFLYPTIASFGEHGSQRVVRHSILVLRYAGFERQFGEPWSEFAGRIRERWSRSGNAFARLMAVQEAFVYNRESKARKERWLGMYFNVLIGLVVGPITNLGRALRRGRSPAPPNPHL